MELDSSLNTVFGLELRSPTKVHFLGPYINRMDAIHAAIFVRESLLASASSALENEYKISLQELLFNAPISMEVISSELIEIVSYSTEKGPINENNKCSGFDNYSTPLSPGLFESGNWDRYSSESEEVL